MTEAATAEASAAHRRAMPIQRLLSGGLEWADATALHAASETGVPWHEAAQDLAVANVQRAETALATGHLKTARSWFIHASACFRFGQIPLTDQQPEKLVMYRNLIETFGRAGELHSPPIKHVRIPWQDQHLLGWLLLPANQTDPPVVIQMGGFDGWREEYYGNACYLLDRGIGCLLVDGPGQGETRLFSGIYLDAHFADAFQAMVDFIFSELGLSTVAIWGNSLGGYLAAAAAITDSRLAACCVNGGTFRPAEILDRYPRFISKVQDLTGIDDPAVARDTLSNLAFTLDDLANLRCPLHVVHGTPDRVFLVANARYLFESAGTEDKIFSEFPDGDHCIYNHAHERNCLIADWFADRLTD